MLEQLAEQKLQQVHKALLNILDLKWYHIFVITGYNVCYHVFTS